MVFRQSGFQCIIAIPIGISGFAFLTTSNRGESRTNRESWHVWIDMILTECVFVTVYDGLSDRHDFD
jgi:hypothetical protein